MTTNVADRMTVMHDAERRLDALAPLTDGWRVALRDVVGARADYWDASRQEYDVMHGAHMSPRRPGSLT